MKQVLALIMLMTFAFLNGADFKMQLPVIEKAPSSDGSIDADEWARAACVSGFSTTDGEWPAEQTSVLAMTDGKMLYFAFKCTFPNSPKAEKHKAGSTKVFGDESVEFFIAPDENNNLYYHFCVNAEGSRYTARCEGGKRDDSWQPELNIATGKFAGGWTLEAAIPLSSINVSAETGKKLKMNFGRNCIAAGRTTSSWTGQGDFNQPAFFGEVILAKNAGTGFSVEKLQAGKNAKFILQNANADTVDFSVNLKCGKWNDSKKTSIKASSSIPLFMEQIPGSGELSVNISAPGFAFNKKCALPYLTTKFTVKPELYYAPSDKKDLTVSFENLPEAVSSIEANILNGTETLLKQSIKADTKKATFDISGLKPGRYAVSAKCQDSNGKAIASDERVFYVMNFAENALPEKQEISISGTVIKMNGKPFLPFARSASKTALSVLEKNSFNVKYGTGERINAPLFDTCGLPHKLLRQPFLCYQLPSDEESFKAIDKSLEKPGNFLFRRLQYEIGIKLCNGKLEELDRVTEYGKFYKYIKGKFPAAAVSIHHDGRNPEELNEFKGGYDILEIASWQSSYAKNPIKNIAGDLQGSKKISGNKPLIWWLGASIPHHDYRNAENLRAASYLSVMHGANGIIFHMGHDGIPSERTRIWSIFRGLADEMEFLYPIIIEGKKVQPSEIKTNSDAIDYIGAILDKKLYVIAVNTSMEALTASFELKGKFSSITTPFEKNRSINISDGRFEDYFNALEPHVYVLELE